MKKFVAGVLLFTMMMAYIMPTNAKAVTYNSYEVAQLQSFLDEMSADGIKTNGEQLNELYNSYSPSTWDGVVWDNNGRVTEISWDGKELVGNLNLSNFSSLEEVSIFGNSGITRIDVSGDNALTKLDVGLTGITKLDVSDNTALTKLDAGGTDITELDVSKNTALTALHVSSTEITKLDVSNNKALTKLDAGGTKITELDVSKNTALTDLNCNNTKITKLDVSNNKALTDLDVHGTGITKLGVSDNTALTDLDVRGMGITKLDVSNNTALTDLDCGDTKITELGVSNNTALTYLDCNNTQITSLDLSKNTALTEFYCNNTKITSLDVSKNIMLENLQCDNNGIKTLALSNNTLLKAVMCDNCELTTLNVNGLKDLRTLDCHNNKLKTLDLSSSTKINNFNCADNNLTQITANISGADISVKAVGKGYVELFKNYSAPYVTAKEITPAKFIKWTQGSTEASKDAKYNLTSGTDYDLKANFTLDVTFNSNGGSSVDPQSLDPDDKITKPSDPTKSGYVFEGWFKDSDLKNAWDFSTDTVADNTTLYAKWDKVLELTLDPSDGTIYKGKSITITPNVEGGTWEYDENYLKRDGNTFTALKNGNTKVTYKVGSQSKEANVTINEYPTDSSTDAGSSEENKTSDTNSSNALPKTGENFTLWFVIGAILLLAGVGLGIHSHKKKA